MLYLDSSALIKRYLKEEGSHAVLAAMATEAAWCSCRVAFVETELIFATWDARLHRAAREHGLRTLPSGLA